MKVTVWGVELLTHMLIRTKILDCSRPILQIAVLSEFSLFLS